MIRIVNESYDGLSILPLRKFRESDWIKFPDATELNGIDDPLVYESSGIEVVISGDDENARPVLVNISLLQNTPGQNPVYTNHYSSLAKALKDSKDIILEFSRNSELNTAIGLIDYLDFKKNGYL